MSLPEILQKLQGQNVQNQQAPTLNNNAVSGIRNIVDIVKNANNPVELLKTMSAQNPNMQKAIDYVNNNGGDPKTAFRNLATQNGIDADAVEKLIHK